MKKFLIAGNWKMNKLSHEAIQFADALLKSDLPNKNELLILAPFTDLFSLKSKLENSEISYGAQNVHFEKKGAFTGEISASMLKETGSNYCIVGHSERRQYFNETDDTVNLKLKALLSEDIIPILCVGEPLDVRNSNSEQTFVASQLIRDFEGISIEDVSKIVIAYEPIWAIGTGKTATPAQAQEMCAFIRGVIGGMYSNEVADNILILYGGSMNQNNAEDLLKNVDINGGLIGGASLETESFIKIAECANKIKTL